MEKLKTILNKLEHILKLVADDDYIEINNTVILADKKISKSTTIFIEWNQK